MERSAASCLAIVFIVMLSGCHPQPPTAAELAKPRAGDATTKPSPVTPYGMAQFAYTTYDEAGTPLTSGMLILPWPIPTDSSFQGTWQAKYSSDDDVAPAPKIGPQIGGGRVVGEMADGKIRLNLNPNMNDNNVVFFLTPGDRALSGTWSYSGFAGVISKGTVNATQQ